MNGTAIGVAIETAIGIGSAYALLALSFTVIFAATGYLHFTLGNVVMLGTVFAYWGSARQHWPVAAVLVLVVTVGGAVGVLSDWLAIRPTRRRVRDPHTVVLLSTLGLAFVITGLTASIFGPDSFIVPSYVSLQPFYILGVPIRPPYVVMVACLLVLATAAQFTIKRTRIGQMLRAVEESHELCRLSGINVSLVISVVFTLAGMLAAFSGFLIAPVTSASAYSGLDLLIDGSAAMVIGGFGSFSGAVIGAGVVGAVVGIGPLFLPPTSVEPCVLLVMVVILLLKPSGLGVSSIRLRRV
jgi:branched-chain amino acid transport system permease protein